MKNSPLTDAINKLKILNPNLPPHYMPLIETNTINGNVTILGRTYKKCECGHYDSNHNQNSCDSCECVVFKRE